MLLLDFPVQCLLLCIAGVAFFISGASVVLQLEGLCGYRIEEIPVMGYRDQGFPVVFQKITPATLSQKYPDGLWARPAVEDPAPPAAALPAQGVFSVRRSALLSSG